MANLAKSFLEGNDYSTLSVDDGGGTLTVDGTLTSTDAASTTGTLSNVSSSATSVTILASNANRQMAMIYNDSTQTLYLKLNSGAASSSSYTVKMFPDDYYELPHPVYTGAITGIWDSANGAARVTEQTA